MGKRRRQRGSSVAADEGLVHQNTVLAHQDEREDGAQQVKRHAVPVPVLPRPGATKVWKGLEDSDVGAARSSRCRTAAAATLTGFRTATPKPGAASLTPAKPGGLGSPTSGASAPQPPPSWLGAGLQPSAVKAGFQRFKAAVWPSPRGPDTNAAHTQRGQQGGQQTRGEPSSRAQARDKDMVAGVHPVSPAVKGGQEGGPVQHRKTMTPKVKAGAGSSMEGRAARAGQQPAGSPPSSSLRAPVTACGSASPSGSVPADGRGSGTATSEPTSPLKPASGAALATATEAADEAEDAVCRKLAAKRRRKLLRAAAALLAASSPGSAAQGSGAALVSPPRAGARKPVPEASAQVEVAVADAATAKPVREAGGPTAPGPTRATARPSKKQLASAPASAEAAAGAAAMSSRSGNAAAEAKHGLKEATAAAAPAAPGRRARAAAAALAAAGAGEAAAPATTATAPARASAAAGARDSGVPLALQVAAGGQLPALEALRRRRPRPRDGEVVAKVRDGAPANTLGLSAADMRRLLQPDAWLSDQPVNFYMLLIRKRHDEAAATLAAVAPAAGAAATALSAAAPMASSSASSMSVQEAAARKEPTPAGSGTATAPNPHDAGAAKKAATGTKQTHSAVCAEDGSASIPEEALKPAGQAQATARRKPKAGPEAEVAARAAEQVVPQPQVTATDWPAVKPAAGEGEGRAQPPLDKQQQKREKRRRQKQQRKLRKRAEAEALMAQQHQHQREQLPEAVAAGREEADADAPDAGTRKRARVEGSARPATAAATPTSPAKQLLEPAGAQAAGRKPGAFGASAAAAAAVAAAAAAAATALAGVTCAVVGTADATCPGGRGSAAAAVVATAAVCERSSKRKRKAAAAAAAAAAGLDDVAAAAPGATAGSGNTGNTAAQSPAPAAPSAPAPTPTAVVPAAAPAVPPPLVSAYAFNSFFFSCLTGHGRSRTALEYDAVRRWTRVKSTHSPDCVLGRELLLFPINHSNTHWCLAAVWPRRRLLQYYDSLGGGAATARWVLGSLLRWLARDLQDKGVDIGLPPQAVKAVPPPGAAVAAKAGAAAGAGAAAEGVRTRSKKAGAGVAAAPAGGKRGAAAREAARQAEAEVAALMAAGGWQLEHMTGKLPRQLDGTSCGLFVCAYAELLARGVVPERFRFQQADMGAIRRGVAEQILRCSL